MKKHITAIATVVLSMTILTGCANPFKHDINYATATISTASSARVDESYNGLNRGKTGQTMAVNHPKEVWVEKGAEVNVEFRCTECGTVIKQVMTCPEARLFECKCPIEGDEEGNAREYILIDVEDVTQKPKEETKNK